MSRKLRAVLNAFPLLRAKASTHEGRRVFTAAATEPCAWACGKCGVAYRGALGEQIAAMCCAAPIASFNVDGSEPHEHAFVTHFVADPPSAEIAARLEHTDAIMCEHGRNPCYLRCGVRSRAGGPWSVIPREERDKWLARVVGMAR
jgi:hypothetical protein